MTAKLPIFAAALLSSLIAIRAPLHAQPASTTIDVGGDNKPWNKGVPLATREAARQIFLEGNRLFKVPLFAQAAEQYATALGKWKHPAFYFNLAVAQLNLGQDLEARDNLERALKHGPEPLGPDEFQEAKQQLQDIQHHLGRIRVACPTPGAEISLDGMPLFTGPGSAEVWVKPQTHEVAAKAPAYLPLAKRVAVTAGALATVDLSPHKLIEDRPWATWKPWAVVGAGAAIAAGGGVLHVVSARNFHAYDQGFLDLPCANTGCQQSDIRPALQTRLDHAKLEQRIAVGAYITGGVAMAAGAVLLYLNRPHLVEQDGATSRSARVSMIPVVSPDMLGMLVTVSQ